MTQVDDALRTVMYWGREVLAAFLGIFAVIEHFLRRLLTQAGVPGGAESLVILAVAVVFILAVLRLFGGFFRVLLVLFLILLLLHILVPNAGI